MTTTAATDDNRSGRLVSTVIDTPVGPLDVVASDIGLRAVLWPDDADDRVVLDAPVTALDVDEASRHPILDAARRQLAEYFAGERTEFDVALDAQGTPFQRSAWAALRTIPFGETVSYGEQAERMGDRNKARAVGSANGKNPISIIVPCHRVVGSAGQLTGFAGGLETKRRLLDHERRVAGTTLV